MSFIFPTWYSFHPLLTGFTSINAESSGKAVKLSGQTQPDVPRRSKAAKQLPEGSSSAVTVSSGKATTADHDDDDVVVVVDPVPSRKRCRTEEHDEPRGKRSKTIDGSNKKDNDDSNRKSNGATIILDD